MNDGLELGQSAAVRENDLREAVAIERAVAHAAGEKLTDLADKTTAWTLQATDHGVGVEDRDSKPLEHLRDGRLSHPDRTGERESDHD
jgi:hypothetical protein